MKIDSDGRVCYRGKTITPLSYKSRMSSRMTESLTPVSFKKTPPGKVEVSTKRDGHATARSLCKS